MLWRKNLVVTYNWAWATQVCKRFVTTHVRRRRLAIHCWANHRLQKVYAYADDLAIMHWTDGDWQVVEGVLSKGMATVSEYLQTWGWFHFNNKEAKRELKVKYNNEILRFCSEPKYLGVTLDRSLMYRRHLELFRKKLTPRFALLRRLAGSGWGAGAITLRTVTLALVHSTA